MAGNVKIDSSISNKESTEGVSQSGVFTCKPGYFYASANATEVEVRCAKGKAEYPVSITIMVTVPEDLWIIFFSFFPHLRC